ncbi:alpha/beta hydrolase family protein [Pseudonocardia nigra]|uniref:alpha/beta hydrolase family protein n=1 Tax=Pseudonocardia nigra TaxID=1921578 RepID=UPI001C604D2A|nr:dienelactone hydrolase family protein [Pseudonocardia nigra]
MTTTRRRALGSGLLAVLAALAMTLAPATAAAQPAGNPFERGPAPTEASIEAARGPYAVADASLYDFQTPGFGSGTITYPTTTSDGTFGVVAISPGYTASESTIAWLGPRIASQGFVVITFNTNSRYDQPAERGEQLLAALDYVTQESSVRDRVDPNRLAVMGHSMGGGGALEAASDRRSIEAAVPLTGYNLDKTWSEVDAATLVIGAEQDSIAPVSRHSIPFYENLTGAEERAYLELNNVDHFAPNSPNTTIGKYSIAWLKRFVDDDTRYTQFLCPGPSAGAALSDVRNSCPIG